MELKITLPGTDRVYDILKNGDVDAYRSDFLGMVKQHYSEDEVEQAYESGLRKRLEIFDDAKRATDAFETFEYHVSETAIFDIVNATYASRNLLIEDNGAQDVSEHWEIADNIAKLLSNPLITKDIMTTEPVDVTFIMVNPDVYYGKSKGKDLSDALDDLSNEQEDGLPFG